MKKIIAIIAFSFFITLLGLQESKSQIFDKAEAAFKNSAESGKSVLLIFSGSDWCAPCIQFDKTILSQNQFQDFVYKHLIILKADFPQRKKLPKVLKEQNEALAERYNPQGIFPYLLLLNSEGLPVAKLNYTHQTLDEFIAEINVQLSKAKHGKT